ncbi:MAG: riboflavin synthase [Bacteroidota bacterium]
MWKSPSPLKSGYMFTGIIKSLGQVENVKSEGTNKVFTIKAPFEEAIHVDQSISHNGVCLTVTDIEQQNDLEFTYSVTAVDETLKKTHLNQWETGTKVNIELCMQMGARLDGHFVQGHVDTVGIVTSVEEVEGSWMYEFRFDPQHQHLLVDKGSVTINGVSLTVVDAREDRFSVTIIPYTYAHTNFHQLQVGDQVNLEFDVLGKYIAKMMKR